jgi:hypothetical protein
MYFLITFFSVVRQENQENLELDQDDEKAKQAACERRESLQPNTWFPDSVLK